MQTQYTEQNMSVPLLTQARDAWRHQQRAPDRPFMWLYIRKTSCLKRCFVYYGGADCGAAADDDAPATASATAPAASAAVAAPAACCLLPLLPPTLLLLLLQLPLPLPLLLLTPTGRETSTSALRPKNADAKQQLSSIRHGGDHAGTTVHRPRLEMILVLVARRRRGRAGTPSMAV